MNSEITPITTHDVESRIIMVRGQKVILDCDVAELDGVQQMRDFLATIEIKSPEHDVFMNVTGKPEADPNMIKENLSLHLTHTVKWTSSMESLIQHPTQPVLLEVSNKAYLGHMLNDFKGFTPEKTVHCRNLIGAI